MSDAEIVARARQILLAHGGENDGTAHPYWCVVKRNVMGANCIMAGPFFSRESAEAHRKSSEYEYGAKSIVYCFTGYYSKPYRELLELFKGAEQA